MTHDDSLPLFLADLSLADGADKQRIAALQGAEATAVYAVARKDRLEAMFLYADHSGAMLVVRAENESTAQAEIQALPYVREGLLTVRIKPLAPYPPLAALYAQDGRTPPGWWVTRAPPEY